MSIIRYTKELLEEICIRDKCIINFDEIKKYNREVKIDFICICGIIYNKTFRQLYEAGGAYCKICTEINRQEKVKKTCLNKYGVENILINLGNIRYTKELLEEICNRDKCIINFNKIKKYNKEIKIDFICICGITYNKTFRQLYEVSGAYCKLCTEINRQEKRIENNLEKYGVEHTSQLQEVKDKSKKTCLDKYGFEHPLQSQEIKDKSKKTCLDKYGVEHSLQSQKVKDKSKKTCLDRYCVEYASQTDIFKNKVKQTNLDKYDVEYLQQSQEFKDKSKKTCLDKYGVEHPSQLQEFQNKIKETRLNKYGVEHVLQSQQIKDNFKQTCLDKYGVEYPIQNAIISEKQLKNSFKLKEFIFPCGNTILVQGYEPFLLKYLIELGFICNDIITKRTEVPEIWYENNNKKHRYYCDVYIPKINTIYEVKSTWTFRIGIEDLLLKKEACIKAGYLFELFVYNDKGVKQCL
jgi:Icc-related predicted phosphoesterase